MDHLEKLLELIRIEQEEDLLQYRRDILQTPLHERKRRGKAWHPVQIHAQDFGLGQLQLTLERTSNLGQNHAFQVGSMVTLYSTEKDAVKEDKLSGTVISAWKDSIKVGFHASELPDWAEDGQLGLDLLFDSATYKEMELALKKVMEAKHKRLKELRPILLGEQPAEFLSPQEAPFFQSEEKLNDSQNEAVRKVLHAQDVAIIHGPPGTGKTTTLVQAIKHTLQNEKQVLVCAPSNTAVDLLTEKLAEKGLKVLRIGNPARISEALIHHSIDGQMSEHPEYKRLKKLRKDVVEYKNLARKYKRSFGKDEREQRKLLFAEARKMSDEIEQIESYIIKSLVEEAQVITATLVGATHKYVRNQFYSTAFIDEAAQALEPATWIPITKAQKIVLAGDHCQLPPTVKSQEAAKQGLEITLFERLMEKQSHASTMLNTQYRMHEQIMSFSSKIFYHQDLQAHESVASQLLGEADDYLLGQPVDFIDTAGCGFEEEKEGESLSTFNEGEAKLLIKHLEQVTSHIGQDIPQIAENCSIGIISPYNAQVNLLKDLAKASDFWEGFGSQIQISSVDGFQGQEKSIIYISLVRCNEQGKIGFLADTRRMNVALTRAKQKLVVIGDSATLGNHKFYQEFLAYIDSIGGYKSAWEWM